MQINLSRHGNIYGPLPIGHHSNFKISTNFWLTYNERKNKFMKYKDDSLQLALSSKETFFFFSFFCEKDLRKKLDLGEKRKKKKGCQSSSIVILTIPTHIEGSFAWWLKKPIIFAC